VGVLACAVGDLAAGAQITLAVDISAPGQAQVIENAIQAAAAQADPLPATNSGLALVQVQNGPAPRYVSTTGVDSGDCSEPLDPCASIPYAITQAADNDTVHLAAGVYSGPIDVDRPLTLSGAGEVSTTISGGMQDRVIFAQDSLTLNALTIADGLAKGRGGGIYASDNLTLTDVSLLRNVTSQDGIQRTGGGGGIYVVGNLVAERGAFQQNRCADNLIDDKLCMVGGARITGNAIFTETHFISNSARGAGGLSASKVWLYDSVFISNTTKSLSGGGANVGEAVIYGGEFRDNHADLCGGALFVDGSTFISGALFTNNTAKSLGGALYSNEESNW
jgi:predicted outer membrane repeat protein